MADLGDLLDPLEEGPYSYTDVKGDGSTVTFTFAFVGLGNGYLRESDIRPFLRDSDENSETYNSYTEMDWDTYQWSISGTQITFEGSTPEASLDDENNIRIRRIMPKSSAYVTTNTKDLFKQDVLNNTFLQQLYSQHEVLDGFTVSSKAQDDLDLGLFRILNLSPAATDLGATNLAQVREEIDDRTASAVADGVADLTAEIADDVAAAAASASDAESSQTDAETAQAAAEAAYASAQALSESYVLKTDTTDTGAALIPNGPEESRPSDVLPWVRFNTDTQEYEGYYPTAGLVASLGGGSLKFSSTSDVTRNMARGEALIVNLSDDVTRTFTVPATFNNSEYFALCIVGKTSDISAYLQLNLTGEYFYLEDGATYDALPIDRNCILVFQKSDGVWYITQAGGVDGEYGDLDARVTDLEDNEVELYNGSFQTSSVTLSEAMENFRKLRVSWVWNAGGSENYYEEQEFTTDVIINTLTSADYFVMSRRMDAGTATNYVILQGRLSSGTTLNISISSSTWTVSGVYKVVGIK